MNYFKLFGLTQKFKINKKLLTKKFYLLQKKYHPDLFVLNNTNIQQQKLKKSIYINQAFQTLKNPYYRAKYLLKLNNINSDEKKFHLQDNIFFIKYFQLCESLNNLKKNNVSITQLNLFKNKEIIFNINKHNLVLVKNFEKEQWLNANFTIQKINYFLKLKEKIEKIIENNSIQ